MSPTLGLVEQAQSISWSRVAGGDFDALTFFCVVLQYCCVARFLDSRSAGPGFSSHLTLLLRMAPRKSHTHMPLSPSSIVW